MSSSPETNSTSHIVPDAPLHPTSPGGNGHRPQVHAHPFNVPHSPLHNPHRRGFIGSPKATLGKAPVGYFPQTSPYTSRSVPGSPLLHHYHHTPPVPLTLLPRMPFLTPDHAEQRKAMETAAAAERQRSKDLEIKEAGLAVAELHGVLKRERQRMARIAGELAAMRTVAGHSQLEAEVMEEGRINSLMRKMDKIQEDKGRVILELEREEEMLTNTLQKKLDAVRSEKRVLEHQIEKEKAVNDSLRKQLESMRDQYLPTADALEEEDEMEEE